MHIEPVIIGAITFLVIGLFHPIVIKTEYYFSHKVWPIFLVLGLVFSLLSIVIFFNIIINTTFAIIGFSSFWSIGELIHQKERVEKGWFPKNEKRKIPYSDSSNNDVK